jgi:uncharacterized SAM-binding protein YcdF (DUF218 family)
MRINEEILELAKKLWDYLQLHQSLEKSDCILVLGSHDLRVAEKGASLYLQQWAPLLIFSGGLGNLTRGLWQEPEADRFAAIALDLGVPGEAMLIENKSTNTGENILFTRRMLEEKKLDPHSFIVVQKPYMERRSYATFAKQWPGKKLIMASPQIRFEEYSNSEISLESFIHIMVGDIQRIRIYPQKGFQIFQPIPDDTWKGYERLVELGFDKHLV